MLSLDRIAVRYANILALDVITLTIPEGSVTGIIGPNGGGKSTLIKLIAGEVTDFDGELLLDGAPLNRTRTRIAYVPQAREVNWDFPLSAHDLVMMGLFHDLGWIRRPSREDNARVSEALATLGLEGMGDRHISQFSGGQQQRLFLARAIVQNPHIVLLDEPMTGLDVTTRETIHQLIDDFVRSGAAVVLASHDLDEVRQICDSVVCLDRRMIASGPTGETFTPENLRRTFGGRIAVFGAG